MKSRKSIQYFSVKHERTVGQSLYNNSLLCRLLHYSNVLAAMATSSGKRNVTVWSPSVRLSHFFPTVIRRAAHTQLDSPGGSTRRSQRIILGRTHFFTTNQEVGALCVYILFSACFFDARSLGTGIPCHVTRSAVHSCCRAVDEPRHSPCRRGAVVSQ